MGSAEKEATRTRWVPSSGDAEGALEQVQAVYVLDTPCSAVRSGRRPNRTSAARCHLRLWASFFKITLQHHLRDWGMIWAGGPAEYLDDLQSHPLRSIIRAADRADELRRRKLPLAAAVITAATAGAGAEAVDRHTAVTATDPDAKPDANSESDPLCALHSAPA